MEEVHHETVLDYLHSFKGLGPDQFLATYKHPFLVENYLAPSSKIKLARVETISEVELNDILPSSSNGEDESLLRVPPITI